MKKLIFIMLAVTVLLSSCSTNEDELPTPKVDESYSFFIAGHSYGSPGTDNAGLHPPFEDKFDLINNSQVEFGVLTGDIVHVSNDKNWDEVDSVLQYLNCEVYFAPGNHDITDRELFESRYGKTFSSFMHCDDLFILLDPNIDEWNISGEQLLFLKNVLSTDSQQARNVFVFFHQLLWIDKNNKYKYVRPNSFEDRADTINFWSEVEPLFSNLSNEVYMFAGDIGAADWSDDVMYDSFENITFIASGMGEGIGDNFVIIDVGKSGKVSFELIALNEEDIHAMGNLEDYIVP